MHTTTSIHDSVSMTCFIYETTFNIYVSVSTQLKLHELSKYMDFHKHTEFHEKQHPTPIFNVSTQLFMDNIISKNACALKTYIMSIYIRPAVAPHPTTYTHGMVWIPPCGNVGLWCIWGALGRTWPGGTHGMV